MKNFLFLLVFLLSSLSGSEALSKSIEVSLSEWASVQTEDCWLQQQEDLDTGITAKMREAADKATECLLNITQNLIQISHHLQDQKTIKDIEEEISSGTELIKQEFAQEEKECSPTCGSIHQLSYISSKAELIEAVIKKYAQRHDDKIVLLQEAKPNEQAIMDDESFAAMMEEDWGDMRDIAVKRQIIINEIDRIESKYNELSKLDKALNWFAVIVPLNQSVRDTGGGQSFFWGVSR